MILREFLHTDPVAISYLLGCGGHAACAVVDPLGDSEPYLRVADQTGMRIRFVVDTHIHADHRSAGRSLASAAGAEYVLHAGAEVSFPFHAAKEGDRLPLGNVVVDVLRHSIAAVGRKPTASQQHRSSIDFIPLGGKPERA